MGNGRNRLSWEITALKLAFNIAEYRSEDPYVIVGACAILSDGSIRLGYNGAPEKVEIDWSNRDERRLRVIHAEANVLNFVKKGDVKIFAVTALPCKDCIKTIAMKGIKEVIYKDVLVGYENDLVKKLAKEFNIILTRITEPYNEKELDNYITKL